MTAFLRSFAVRSTIAALALASASAASADWTADEWFSYRKPESKPSEPKKTNVTKFDDDPLPAPDPKAVGKEEQDDAEKEDDDDRDSRDEVEATNRFTAFLDDGSLPPVPTFQSLPGAVQRTGAELRQWVSEEIDPPGAFLREERVDLRAPVSVNNSLVPPPEGWHVEYRFMTSQAKNWIQGGNPLSDEELQISWNDRLASTSQWATQKRIYDRHVLDLNYGIQRGVGVYVRPLWEAELLEQRSFDSAATTKERSYGDSGISEIAVGALLDLYDDPQNVIIVQLGAVAPMDVVSGYRPSWALDAPPGTIQDDWFTPDWRVQPAITYKHYGKWWSSGVQWQSDWEVSESAASGQIDQTTQVQTWFAYILDKYKTLAVTVRGEAVWREVGHEDRIPPSLMLSDPRLQDGQAVNLGYGLMFQLPMGGRLNLEVAHMLYQYSPDVQVQDQFALAASYSKTF